MNFTFFNETCLVISSYLQKETIGSRFLWFLPLGCIFSRWQHNWEGSGMCNKDDFRPGLAWKFISKERLCRSLDCIALHNIGVFFCFQKGMLVLWCFNTPKKGWGKDERKKAKLYFTSTLKGLLASHIHDCSIFWGSKAAFEAGRYVLIIWRLNDDTEFIINGPHPSTLPLPHNSPEWEWVLALAAFALFDLFVITPLFGDHTTSFMLNEEALKVGFQYKFQKQLPPPFSFLQRGNVTPSSNRTMKYKYNYNRIPTARSPLSVNLSWMWNKLKKDESIDALTAAVFLWAAAL